MRTIRPILADNSTSISELKKNPMAVVEQGDGFPVAVLNRNQPAFYCVPADAYEIMMDKLEDFELAQLVKERQNQPEIKVSISDL
jgi:antitoxin StbD